MGETYLGCAGWAPTSTAEDTASGGFKGEELWIGNKLGNSQHTSYDGRHLLLLGRALRD